MSQWLPLLSVPVWLVPLHTLHLCVSNCCKQGLCQLVMDTLARVSWAWTPLLKCCVPCAAAVTATTRDGCQQHKSAGLPNSFAFYMLHICIVAVTTALSGQAYLISLKTAWCCRKGGRLIVWPVWGVYVAGVVQLGAAAAFSSAGCFLAPGVCLGVQRGGDSVMLLWWLDACPPCACFNEWLVVILLRVVLDDLLLLTQPVAGC
jgi:hypothetical protein